MVRQIGSCVWAGRKSRRMTCAWASYNAHPKFLYISIATVLCSLHSSPPGKQTNEPANPPTMATRSCISALSRAASLARLQTTKTTVQTQARLLQRAAAEPCLPLSRVLTSRFLTMRAAPRAAAAVRRHRKLLTWAPWRGYSTEKDAPAVAESKFWNFEAVRNHLCPFAFSPVSLRNRGHSHGHAWGRTGQRLTGWCNSRCPS